MLCRKVVMTERGIDEKMPGKRNLNKFLQKGRECLHSTPSHVFVEFDLPNIAKKLKEALGG